MPVALRLQRQLVPSMGGIRRYSSRRTRATQTWFAPGFSFQPAYKFRRRERYVRFLRTSGRGETEGSGSGTVGGRSEEGKAETIELKSEEEEEVDEMEMNTVDPPKGAVDRIIYWLDQVRDFERERVPPKRLPRYVQGFLISKKQGSNTIRFRRTERTKNEIITIFTKITPMDQLDMDAVREVLAGNVDETEPIKARDSDESYPFHVIVQREADPIIAIFYCTGIDESFDVDRLQIIDLKTTHSWMLNTRRIKKDEFYNSLVEELIKRGVTPYVCNHILDQRILEECEEYLRWMTRVQNFLKH